MEKAVEPRFDCRIWSGRLEIQASIFSAIQAEGYRRLGEGDKVGFSIEDSPKGPQATNVVKLP